MKRLLRKKKTQLKNVLVYLSNKILNIHQFIKSEKRLSPVTDKRKISQLIEQLHPYQTQFDLIRLGPNDDGSYLIPNSLQGIEACFSPGVGTMSEFELDCLKNGMKIYMADKSVDKPNLNIQSYEYNFIQKFVGCTNNSDFITMDEWVNSSNLSKNSDLLLQMDIEDGEYTTIINMSDALIERFRIMVIEFHSLEELWNPIFFDLAETVFKKILQTHICIHIHPNPGGRVNRKFGIEIPKVAEFTFLRRDCAEIKGYANDFPHHLDYDYSMQVCIPLPKNWYKRSLS